MPPAWAATARSRSKTIGPHNWTHALRLSSYASQLAPVVEHFPREQLLTSSTSSAALIPWRSSSERTGSWADIADIRNLSADEAAQGTAEAVEVSGSIRCTTTIEYGIVAAVAQPDVSDSFQFQPDGDPMGPESAIQGVAAFGPNAGNEANSPCSTSVQDYEIVVQRNRDSGTFSDTGANAPPDNMEVIVTAGTSAENGDRGPGPFIGDWGLVAAAVDFTRTDP